MAVIATAHFWNSKACLPSMMENNYDTHTHTHIYIYICCLSLYSNVCLLFKVRVSCFIIGLNRLCHCDKLIFSIP